MRLFLFQCIILSVFFGVSHPLHSQKTNDTEYENFIAPLIKMSKKKQLDSIEILIEKIENKYDLDCVQSARVYQKKASCLFNLNRFKESSALNIEKVINVWNSCDSAQSYYLFLPVKLVIESCINSKEIYKALDWINFMESKENIFENISHLQLIKYYFIASNVYSRIGNKILSDEYLKKVEPLVVNTTSPKMRYSRLRYYNIKGQNEFVAGDIEKSIASYEKALENVKYADDALIVYANYASPLIEIKSYDKAREYLEAALEYSKSFDNIAYKIFINKQRIKLEIAENNLDVAEDVLAINDTLIDKTIHYSDYAFNENQRAIIAARHENTNEVINRYNLAINALLVDQEVDINNASLNFNKGIIKNVESLKIVLNTAVDIFKESYSNKKDPRILSLLKNAANGLRSLYKRNRNDFNSEAAGLDNLSKTYNFYEEIINIIYDEYKVSNDKSLLEEMLKYSIENKNDILTNLHSSKKIYEKYLTPDEFYTLSQLESKKRKIEIELSSSIVDSLKITHENYLDINKEITEIKSNVQRKYSPLKDEITRIENDFPLKEIQNYLTSSQILLDVFYGNNHIFLTAISKNETRIQRVKIDSLFTTQIRELIKQAYDYGNIEKYKILSYNVFDKLFKGVLDENSNAEIRTIIILNDGLLHNIPLGTYWTGKKFLIQDLNTIYLSHISQIRPKKMGNTESYQGFATAYTNNLSNKLNTTLNRSDIQLSQLQSNIDELQTNSSDTKGKLFINEKCTKSTFVQSSKLNKGILHTALHGLELNANTAALIFDDRAEDFILTTDEVYNLSLENTLTILSACYSGKGKIYSGEGIRNLTRSFLFAGSENVISSLWAASDDSNKSILNNFLTNVSNNQNLALSLGKAKRAYIESVSPAYQHPSYWGNLVLVGGNEDNQSSTERYLVYFAIASLFLLILTIFFKLKK